MVQRLKTLFLRVWSHRTKILGGLAIGAAFVQNNAAAMGSFIPPKYTGAILAIFGCLAFAIGLFNTIAAEV